MNYQDHAVLRPTIDIVRKINNAPCILISNFPNRHHGGVQLKHAFLLPDICKWPSLVMAVRLIDMIADIKHREPPTVITGRQVDVGERDQMTKVCASFHCALSPSLTDFPPSLDSTP